MFGPQFNVGDKVNVIPGCEEEIPYAHGEDGTPRPCEVVGYLEESCGDIRSQVIVRLLDAEPPCNLEKLEDEYLQYTPPQEQAQPEPQEPVEP